MTHRLVLGGVLVGLVTWATAPLAVADEEPVLVISGANPVVRLTEDGASAVLRARISCTAGRSAWVSLTLEQSGTSAMGETAEFVCSGRAETVSVTVRPLAGAAALVPGPGLLSVYLGSCSTVDPGLCWGAVEDDYPVRLR